MIVAQGVSKSFGTRTVLRGLELQAARGAVSLLVGSNGAGKSTLLRIISGLARPDRGRILLNGIPLHESRGRALEQLSFLPQAPQFHARLTTRQVATYYARLRLRSVRDVDHELAQWELAEHAGVITHHLSGGLRQRLALAVFALARAPLLVLDEPGLSLDPPWRERLQQFLADRAAEGATVLVATHLLGEWEGRADVGYLLADGAIAGELAVDRLRDAFARADVAAATPAVASP